MGDCRNDHRAYLEPEFIPQRAQGTQDCLPLFSLLLWLWIISLRFARPGDKPSFIKYVAVHSVNREIKAQIEAAALSVPLVVVELDLGHVL